MAPTAASSAAKLPLSGLVALGSAFAMLLAAAAGTGCCCWGILCGSEGGCCCCRMHNGLCGDGQPAVIRLECMVFQLLCHPGVPLPPTAAGVCAVWQ